MAFCVILLISITFFQAIQAENVLSNKERARLDSYVQDLFEEKIASRDKEIQALYKRLNQGEKEINALKARLSRTEDSIQHIEQNDQKHLPASSNISRRYLLNGGISGSAVGFMACVSPPDLLNLGDKHTILFDKVITNTGGAYHNHTGVFMAPVKGLYEFQLTAMSAGGNHQYLAFMRDGTVISNIYPDAAGSPSYETAGNQWVVELNQGSEVWIQTQGAGTIHGNCFTVLSGFLIEEME